MTDQKILARAQQILAQAKADPIVIERALPKAGELYWEQADGRIIGPARPEFLAMVNSGPTTSFWIVTEYAGQGRWIRSDRLRSQKAFLEQRQIREIELIRF